MSHNVKDDPDPNTPTAELLIGVNSRIDEIERRQRKDEEDERSHNLKQLRVNRTIALFTALLFVTSTLSVVYLVRQTNTIADQKSTMDQTLETMFIQTRVMQGQLEQMKGSSEQTDKLIASGGVSADAAKSAANTAAKSLETTDRPWVQITNATVVTPLSFEGNKISVGIMWTVKSIGNSAAMEIAPKWRLIAARGAGTVPKEVLKEQKSACASKDAPGALPLTLFPGQSSSDVWAEALQFNTWLNDISGHIEEMPPPSREKVIWPILVGCIDYQSSFGVHHQSGFIYNLRTNGYFVVGHDIPEERLIWERYAFGGFDVN